MGMSVPEQPEHIQVPAEYLLHLLVARILHRRAHEHRLAPADVDLGREWHQAAERQPKPAAQHRDSKAGLVVDPLRHAVHALHALESLVLVEDVGREEIHPVLQRHADEAEVCGKDRLLLIMPRSHLLPHAARLQGNRLALGQVALDNILVYTPGVNEHERLRYDRDSEEDWCDHREPLSAVGVADDREAREDEQGRPSEEAMGVPDDEVPPPRVQVLQALTALRCERDPHKCGEAEEEPPSKKPERHGADSRPGLLRPSEHSTPRLDVCGDQRRCNQLRPH
mmetsp:Transcript_52583/g.151610  ORF Transcript_52583/g.151610 Transcript_52583/m.151610 type:complete len:282 (-) Transcript_52583:120-965(-)